MSLAGAMHGRLRVSSVRLVNDMEVCMRKMILMAVAGFVWKKFMAKRSYNGTVPGRF
jgi:hypothetical protein